MADMTLTTFDWVPEMPRGYVRDLRVRWASTGWRDFQPIVTMSRAPRPAPPLPRHTQTRWRILLR
jgi:hypothetical protein